MDTLNPFKRLADWRAQRKAAEARRRTAEHYRRQLQHATDHAINAAAHARYVEPVTDLQIIPPLRVTIGDVTACARADFNLDVPRADAAAMLRERLIWRSYSHEPELITDAFDEEEGRRDDR